MYCTRCGVQIDESAAYCSQCGAATVNAPKQPGSTRHLSRSREDAKIAGVCAGVARYFDIDVNLVRVLWCVLSIWPPCAGIIAYVICWIVIPRDPLALLPAGLDTAKPAN